MKKINLILRKTVLDMLLMCVTLFIKCPLSLLLFQQRASGGGHSHFPRVIRFTCVSNEYMFVNVSEKWETLSLQRVITVIIFAKELFVLSFCHFPSPKPILGFLFLVSAKIGFQVLHSKLTS